MQTKTFLQRFKNLIVSFLILISYASASAQAQLAPQSAFDWLTPEEGAAITLELDLTDLINNKNTNQYFAGSLTAPNGKMLKVEVRPRGRFRRRICEVPPLKLKFPKKELRANGLDTLNEIKMVVPCFDDPESEELVLREYLAYRMFERLSPLSVRARLVKVAFRDKHVEEAKKPVYCLLVEHDEQIAARLGGQIVKQYSLTTDSLQTTQAAITAMFQYMIGNTDWGVGDVRNVYFLQPTGGEKIQLIPYDFDFAGLVNAPYAKPKAELGLKNVKERRLMSGNLSKVALEQAAATIKSAQNDLMALCSAPFLSKNTSKELTKYMDSFFQNIDNVPSLVGKSWKGDLR